MPFRAPVEDIRRLLEHAVDFDRVAETERFAEADSETVAALLTEAGRLADEVIAPLNRAGDLHPARLEDGVVHTSPGFAEGYRAMAEGGWLGLSAPVEYGGMGFPQTLTTALNDILSGACLALQLNPVLTQGQIEALAAHGSDELRALYLPKLISGEWSGTMNLTEPQAGSDVGALMTRAEPAGDGTYRITGQKIYISWADADFMDNICHLVLARLPDSPPGTKGISLFLVPRNLPDSDGPPGKANALRVGRLEHKMGIHGSPTAVLEYEGATGWMVGAPNGGMAAMFTMMNNARLAVGTQGIGVAEAACQMALDHARTRKQGRAPRSGAIVEHADVRRMLMEMRAETRAARAIALACAVATDLHGATGAPEHAARAAFLTPIAKAYGTDTGINVAQLNTQVHGGLGYIEETGAAQLERDVRITAIYEGTNGIQAMDLVGRKLADGGSAANALIDEILATAARARADLGDLSEQVRASAEDLRAASVWLVEQSDMDARNAGAVAYLKAFARVLGAHFHLKTATGSGDAVSQALARFYILRLLPEVQGLLLQVRAGKRGLFDLSAEELAE